MSSPSSRSCNRLHTYQKDELSQPQNIQNSTFLFSRPYNRFSASLNPMHIIIIIIIRLLSSDTEFNSQLCVELRWTAAKYRNFFTLM
jgi:hypothetical protein